MRIAIVSDYFLDYVGGAQSSIVEQRTALESAGHCVRLISTARGLDGRLQTSATGDLRVRPLYTIPGAEFPVVHANDHIIAGLRDYMRTERIDVVHLQTEFGLAHAATVAARTLGVPVVFTVHTFYWQSTGRWPQLLAPLLRWALGAAIRSPLPIHRLSPRHSDNLLRNVTLEMAGQADRVISPSAHQARDLAASGLQSPVSVIPNPVAHASRRPRLIRAPSDGRLRVLWVARCEPEKRPLVFAEAAMLALDETEQGFDVDIVGDGSQRAELMRRTAGHPNIRVHGSLPRERVIELIDASSVIALTSVGFDNQPMTIAEATSRFRGVVFCDPLLKEGLDNAGILTPDSTPAGIASVLIDLVRHPERIATLSAAAQIDGETFSASIYLERVMRVYADALEQKSTVV